MLKENYTKNYNKINKTLSVENPIKHFIMQFQIVFFNHYKERVRDAFLLQ